MTNRLTRSTVMAALALAMAGGAEAQLARPRPGQVDPNAPKLLVSFFWFDRGDSAAALLVSDGVRERARLAFGMRWNTISRQNINENLIQSGFPPDVPLEQNILRTLTRFLNARLVIEGRLTRVGADSIYVAARLYEATGQVPQSANVLVATTRQRIGTATGTEIANRLEDASRSFQDVAQCRQALEANNRQRAWQKARDALRDDPNSTGAYLCIASILEAEQAPADSILAILRIAHEKDTVNTVVMRRLAARYEAAADTNSLVSMLRRILTIDLRDNELRIATARLFANMRRWDDAIAVVDQGLGVNPASLELLQTKSIALGGARRWSDAAATLAQVGEIDSNQIDSLFLFRITSFYREAADTTGLYRWIQVANQRAPQQANYWFESANLAMANADTNASMQAAERYVTLRPDDGRGLLLIARVLMARGHVDSAITYADRAAAADSTLRPVAGNYYLSRGLRMISDTTRADRWEAAIPSLQRARDWVPETARQQFLLAAFYLGMSQVQRGVQADTEAQNGRSCDAARLSHQLMTSAEPNVIAGAAQNRELASQLLQAITGYRGRAEQFLRLYNCPAPPASAAPGR